MPPAKKKSTSAPKKSASAKKSEKRPAAATPSFIDTSLAASAAARMIAARAAGQLHQPTGDNAKETSLFKQMKENLARPHAAVVDSILNESAAPGARPGDLPGGGPQQVGHNQTFNADVARRNLPRRTGG